jgi:hypothetical protein
MELYGMVAASLGAFMLLLTTREFIRRRIGTLSYSLWAGLWIALILIGAVPQFYYALVLVTQALGMLTPIHFVTTFSVLALFAATYVLEKQIAQLNEKLNKITQHIALMNSSNKRTGTTSSSEKKPRS